MRERRGAINENSVRCLRKYDWRAAVVAAWCAVMIGHVGRADAQSVGGPPGDAGRPAATAGPVASGERRPGQEPAGKETRPAATAWGLPPLRWGGSVSTELRAERTEDQPRRLRQAEIGNVRASSYIWQPWFALVSGGLGWLASKERGDEDPGSVLNPARDSSSHAVTGNGEVTLFPLSRFPFSAYFDVSDSRASGEPSVSDTKSHRFGARQNYRPLEGNANYAASFNRSTLTSAAFGRDTVDALAASMNRNAGPHALDVSGSHTRNTRSNTRESAVLSQLAARHSYRPEPELSIESLASASGSDFHLVSAGVPTDNRSRFAQANTFVTWRPAEDAPLQVTGGGRMFRAAIASQAGETESLTMSANVAATYSLSRQTSISGGATVTQLLSDAASGLLTTQTANVTHTGDPLELLGFTYAWNAAGNIANQTGLPEGTRQNAGGQLGHNLTRNLMLGEASQVNLSLGQSYGSTFDTVTERSQTLGHNGSVTWRLTRDAATSAHVSVLGADSRTSGHNENRFQMANLQVSGQAHFSRSSSATANMTVQSVRQSTPTASDTGFRTNSSGSLGYFHLRVFDVPRLRYTALYSVNESQYRTRLQGDVNAPRERVDQSFEQRLDYSMGRVALRLSLRVAEIDGRRDALIFFRMAREFGGF